MTEDLINRISFYLASGGLFNPELADHIAVRNLLMECREALAQRTWVGLTPQERDEINERVYGAVPHHVAFHAAIEQALREKNT